MIVDSSAIIAILGYEPEQAFFLQALRDCSEPIQISAATYVEASIVIDRRRMDPAGLDELLTDWGIEIIPLSVRQARYGREAFETFGKGRHKARLNFGDCFSYALSKDTGAPLLCKGKDFALTDLLLTSPPAQ